MTTTAPTFIDFKDFPGSEATGTAVPTTWTRMAFPLGTTEDEVVQAAVALVNGGKVMVARVCRYDLVAPLHELGWQRYGAV